MVAQPLPQVLHKARDHAKLRRVSWHSMQRATASLMGASSANLKEVQEVMGHGNIQVTMDLYTHLFPEAKRDAIGRMDKFMTAMKPDKVEEETGPYRTHTRPDRPSRLMIRRQRLSPALV